MANTFTSVFTERRHPGGRILTVVDMRLDDNYAAPYTVTPLNVGLIKRIDHIIVQPRNTYLIWNAQPAPNALDYHVYAVASIGSGNLGMGGVQLNSNSSVIQGQVLRLYCLGA